MKSQSFFSALNREERYNIISYFVAFLGSGIFVILLGSILPMVKSEYGLSYSLGGVLLSSHSFGNLSASFISGVVPLYIGIKRSAVLFNALPYIGLALIMLTGNPILLIAAFLLTGIGRSGLNNYCNSAVNSVSGGNSSALNLLHSCFAIGAFSAPFIVLFCTRSSGYGWKGAVTATILFGIISCALLMKTKMAPASERMQSSHTRSFEFMKNGRFWITCGILFFYLGAENGIIGWLVTYFTDSGLMSLGFAQALSAILWIVILLGRLLCSYLARLVPDKAVLLTSSVGVSIFFILMVSSQNPTLITIYIIGLGFCMSGIYPTSISNTGAVIKNYPMAMGTLLTLTTISAIITPGLIGFVAEHTGIDGGMTLITGSVLAMLACAAVNAVY